MRGALLHTCGSESDGQPCHGVAINDCPDLREVQNMRFFISFSRKCSKVVFKKNKVCY